MSEMQRILCPTDFSDCSEHAMLYAQALAKNAGASIDCLHVVNIGFLKDGVAEGIYVTSADLNRSVNAIENHAAEEMEKVVRRAKLRDVAVKGHTRKGHPAEEIAKAAHELGCGMIVIATHGQSKLERLMFGSVANRVVRLSTVPVLTVKTHEHEFVDDDDRSINIKRVLCPLDFSEFSQEALPHAVNLCRDFGATLVLCHVVDPRMDYAEWTAQAMVNNSEHLVAASQTHLEQLVEQIKGLSTEVKVIIGVPASTLIGLVEEENIDLVVMPTHGRKGISHALLGSTAETLATKAPCPVLTVHPNDEA